MAGGKLTPRQKMVNLMYLVFIAMMALNMSKEVLSAFGLLNEQFEESNTKSVNTNDALYQSLVQKAAESGGEFAEAKTVADQVKSISAKFYSYIATAKNEVVKEFEKTEQGKLPYEAMDKGDYIDEKWFAGDGYSQQGQAFINAIDTYKKDMSAVLSGKAKYKATLNDINSKFNTVDVVDGEGVKKKWLDYHFKGFPAIASVTQLSAMQSDVKNIEASIYSSALGQAAVATASMTNYKAIVLTEKSAFFAGESVTGRVVLGRYDQNTVPDKVVINGANQPVENGQVNFKFGAGNVGEHDITGTFTFTEDGKAINIPVEGNYVVVPKPNSATISADKMNSVYRGVNNPMTISFAGVSDNNVSASAPGSFSKGSKTGAYNWNVSTVGGTKAKVVVTATLPGGEKVSDQKEFIIRDIPQPVPELRGKRNSSKGNKNDLANSTVNAVFPDFVFDLDVSVKSFEVFVPGSPTIICQGNRFNSAALAAINKAGRGDVVIISNIDVDLKGSPVRIQKSSAFTWEVQ